MSSASTTGSATRRELWPDARGETKTARDFRPSAAVDTFAHNVRKT
jgi:hypothetical protein